MLGNLRGTFWHWYFSSKAKLKLFLAQYSKTNKKCAQLKTLNVNPFHHIRKTDINLLSKMYFPDLYRGTPLQKASSVQRGVSLKTSARFPNPWIQKGKVRQLLLTTYLLKRISLSSHYLNRMKKQEGGAKPTILPHMPSSTSRLFKEKYRRWAYDYTVNNFFFGKSHLKHCTLKKLKIQTE